MICKNISEPYTRLFSGWVIQAFLDSYHDVDQTTRSRMEELVLTWRNGSATRKELFGVAAQVAIERGIWGDGASGSNVRVASLFLESISYYFLVTSTDYSKSSS